MGNKRTEITNQRDKLHYYKKMMKFHNSLHMKEIMEKSAEITGKSVQAFVTDAILDAASKLGITPESVVEKTEAGTDDILEK